MCKLADYLAVAQQPNPDCRPMQYVVDTNYLQSEALRKFLSRSNSNRAVLTDYAAMEAYKSKIPDFMFQQMKIPAEFPKQIIVLKHTRMAGALSGRTKGLQKRLIDKDQTKNFSQYCADLEAAQSGDPRLKDELLEHHREALEHMENMLTEMSKIMDAFKGIEGTFTKDEIRDFRVGASYSGSALETLFGNINEMTFKFIKTHPY